MSYLDWTLRGTVGLYAAFVLVPLATIVSVEAGNSVPGLEALFSTGMAVMLVITLVAAGIPDLARHVSTARAFVPIAVLPLGLLSSALLRPSASTTAVVAVMALIAVLLGAIVVALGATKVKRERLEDATTLVSFESGGEDSDNSWSVDMRSTSRGVVDVGVGVVVFGGIAAIVATGFETPTPTSLLGTLVTIFGAFATLFDDGDSHEIRVTDTGIVVDDGLLRRETITDARFDDGEFVVERAGLRPNRSVDATDVRGAGQREIESALEQIV